MYFGPSCETLPCPPPAPPNPPPPAVFLFVNRPPEVIDALRPAHRMCSPSRLLGEGFSHVAPNDAFCPALERKGCWGLHNLREKK